MSSDNLDILYENNDSMNISFLLDDVTGISEKNKNFLKNSNILNPYFLEYEGIRISKVLSSNMKKINRNKLFIYSYSSRFTDSKIIIECK